MFPISRLLMLRAYALAIDGRSPLAMMTILMTILRILATLDSDVSLCATSLDDYIMNSSSVKSQFHAYRLTTLALAVLDVERERGCFSVFAVDVK